MVGLLVLLACGECEESEARDTGERVEDTGTEDTGTEDTGTEDSLRAEEVLVDLSLRASAEGPWELELDLTGDGVFADRIARAVVYLERVEAKDSHTLSLEPAGVRDLFVGVVDNSDLDEAGLSLEPRVVEGESYTLKIEPEVQDVDYEEVEEASLPMLGSWELPEAYNSPTVFGLIDASTGELILKTTSRGEAAHYPVGAFGTPSGEAIAMHSQQNSWRAGKDAPSGPLDKGEELQVDLELYDADGDLVGTVSRTAMYGDIIMGGVALDDFDD